MIGLKNSEVYIGRTIYCHNKDCPKYRYTLFRQVLVQRFTDHEKQTFSCTTCGSMHIIESELTG